MAKPNHGRLFFTNNQWSFRPGQKPTNEHITLPDFEQTFQDLTKQKQLFQGHVKFSHVCTARCSFLMSTFLANHIATCRHVSATNLENLTEPLLSEHNKLTPGDKVIWDAAYGEEIEGLLNLPCWRKFSASKYQKLQPMIGNAIPTMAISTIKYDENGQLKRDK